MNRKYQSITERARASDRSLVRTKALEILTDDDNPDDVDLYGYSKDDQFNPSIARRRVGSGLGLSVITAPVFWIARQASEAVFRGKLNDDNIIEDHPLIDLLSQPNPYYIASRIWMALSIDLTLQGNAYLEIERDELKEPIALHWIPSIFMEPKGTETVLITHYVHMVNGKERHLRKEDVIHVAFGLDSMDLKRGLSPLQGIINEAFTDSEAALFTAAVLANQGFPGIVISPKEGDGGADFDQKLADKLKTFFRKALGRGNRGDVAVVSDAISMDKLEIDLSKLSLEKLRQVPESRVCAVTGVPAAVVGFALGIAQTKVGATMTELRKEAYESAVVPLMKLLVKAFNEQLVPEWPQEIEVVQDLRAVRVLRDYTGGLQDRIIRLWEAGLIQHKEARRDLGYPDSKREDYYPITSGTPNNRPAGGTRDTTKPSKNALPNDEEEFT